MKFKFLIYFLCDIAQMCKLIDIKAMFSCCIFIFIFILINVFNIAIHDNNVCLWTFALKARIFFLVFIFSLNQSKWIVSFNVFKILFIYVNMINSFIKCSIQNENNIEKPIWKNLSLSLSLYFFHTYTNGSYHLMELLHDYISYVKCIFSY